jgi:hypothetical protein
MLPTFTLLLGICLLFDTPKKVGWEIHSQHLFIKFV